MSLYVKYAGDETAKRAYANFEKYVEPFISEANINNFIADLKGLKDLTFEKMHKMFKAFMDEVEVTSACGKGTKVFLRKKIGEGDTACR